MSAEIRLEFDVLEAHARRVEQLAVDASGVAGTVTGGISGQAFGTLGGFLVGAVDGACDALHESCIDASRTFQDIAVQLRSVAAEAQELEQDIVNTLRQLEVF